MLFDELTTNLFNENDVYFYLLVHEKEHSFIYKDLDRKIIAGEIKDVNYMTVLVEEIVRIDEEIYYKLNLNDTLKGYLKPEDSIIFIPKNRQQIKLKEETTFTNSLNTYLSISHSDFEDKKNKISFSTHYVLFKNEVYESVYHQDEVIGFFKPEDILLLHRLRMEFKIVSKSSLYKDSSLTKEAELIEPLGNKFVSEFIIEEENVIRFKYKNSTCWIPKENTDVIYNPVSYIPKNPSEVLMMSIIHQYKNKLQKSHSYYLKILNKELKKSSR